MKLQQLRYAVEVFRRNLSVSEAAEALFTSQPGISKQIRLLEEELGMQIFIRSGKRIIAVTEPGRTVLETAGQILRDVQNIRNISGEFADAHKGMLTVAATPAQLRFRLPDAISRLAADYPEVQLTLRQGSAAEAAEMVYNGNADIALVAEAPEDYENLRRLPCGEQHYALVVPEGHRLVQKKKISLSDIAACPLLAYEPVFRHGSVLARAFGRIRTADYRVALASADDGILKTYIRLGLGIGLLDRQSCGTDGDGLAVLDVSRLIEAAPVQILLRPDALIRGYVYDFIGYLNPALTREKINRLLYAPAVEDFSI